MGTPYLCDNLINITKSLFVLEKSNPSLVMEYPDNLKLCSCMPLFEIAIPDVPEFEMALEKFYDGKRDQLTMNLVNAN